MTTFALEGGAVPAADEANPDVGPFATNERLILDDREFTELSEVITKSLGVLREGIGDPTLAHYELDGDAADRLEASPGTLVGGTASLDDLRIYGH